MRVLDINRDIKSHNVYSQKSITDPLYLVSESVFTFKKRNRQNAWLHNTIAALAYFISVNTAVVLIVFAYQFFWGN